MRDLEGIILTCRLTHYLTIHKHGGAHDVRRHGNRGRKWLKYDPLDAGLLVGNERHLLATIAESRGPYGDLRRTGSDPRQARTRTAPLAPTDQHRGVGGFGHGHHQRRSRLLEANTLHHGWLARLKRQAL
jgi:hypothetical protein